MALLDGNLQYIPLLAKNEMFFFSPAPLISCIKQENLTLLNEFIQFVHDHRDPRHCHIRGLDEVYNEIFRNESTSPQFVERVLSKKSKFRDLHHKESIVCVIFYISFCLTLVTFHSTCAYETESFHTF